VGLGLWNSRLWTILVEGGIFAIGATLYARATHPRDRLGSYSLRLFIGVLGVTYLLNIFGPPPPSEKAIAFSALGMWLFVVWAYWLDRHRLPGPPASRPDLITLGTLSDQPRQP
jgi:hypothetical protein